MASETFIANDLHSSLRDLMIVGAVKSCENVVFPFDPQLSSYVAEKDGEWLELLQSIEQFCGLGGVLLYLATDRNPWRDLSDTSACYDFEQMNGEVLLACNESEWRCVDFKNTVDLSQELQRMFEIQIVEMFDSLLQAHYCFGLRTGNVRSTLNSLVSQACSIAAFPVADGSSERLLQRVYQWWKERKYLSDVADEGLDEGFRKWLSAVIVPEFE